MANSMDEDDLEICDEGEPSNKRRVHTAAEQKRRDAIKRGYEALQGLVPGCNQTEGIAGIPQKLSKAQVLHRSIDYIQYLSTQKKRQEEELEALEKEVKALRIMKANVDFYTLLLPSLKMKNQLFSAQKVDRNYDTIVKVNQSQTPERQEVTDELKFSVFCVIIESLWETFSATISVTSFEVLSGCIFSWLEEHCKPQAMRTVVINALRKVFSGRQ